MVSHKFFSFSLSIGLVAMSFLATTPISSAELEEIEQRGKLIVAVKDNLRPLGFRGEDGNLQGLEIDIARHLAEELLGDPNAVVLQPVTNLDRLNVVLNGKVDLTIARVSFTESRARLVDLSEYYYLDGTGLVTKDASITELEDVATRKIAVIKDSSTIPVVKDALPSSKLVGVDSYEEALSLLEKGGADAFAADKTVLAGWVQEYPQYRLLSARLSGEALCVVIPKGLQYTRLHRKVNEAIARWQAEGWLAERAAAWGLP
ncbi:MAG: transporter substrate-binding domain-containing protein [Symploca sp. SIO1A3]|nr:transporter substrate-binding domain-containing protein [Symploca sp. SIO1A3]